MSVHNVIAEINAAPSSAADFKAAGIKADVIAESTAAAGVTIDGVQLGSVTSTLPVASTRVIADAIYTNKLRLGPSTNGIGDTIADVQSRVRMVEDFLADAGATLPVPWGKQDTSAAGTPTIDYVADALNGTYTLTHDGTSEAQTMTLYWADQLMIDPTKNPIVEFRLKINFAGANFSADQRIVIGLASARNATLDSVVTNVWFRIEGANLNILKEADDGTTDTDDVDTTIDIVDNTYTTFRIDLSDTSAIGMYVNGVAAGGAALAAAALAASMPLQPFVEIQRDAGTEAEAVTIDYIMVEQDRT